ncbi:MAG: phosphoribosyl-ATP diphosphatase [Candidatus Hodgkinia cicadicola]
MLNLGFKAVLKKVNEEAAEFALAVCCESSKAVLREAADTIYHIVLSLIARGLNLNGLLHNLSFRSGWVGPFRTLGILEPLADSIHDGIVYRRNKAFTAGWKVESSVSEMINDLYQAVFNFTFLCTRLGVSTYVDTCALYHAAGGILISLMVLLCHRRIRYQRVANELYARIEEKTMRPTVWTTTQRLMHPSAFRRNWRKI